MSSNLHARLRRIENAVGRKSRIMILTYHSDEAHRRAATTDMIAAGEATKSDLFVFVRRFSDEPQSDRAG